MCSRLTGTGGSSDRMGLSPTVTNSEQNRFYSEQLELTMQLLNKLDSGFNGKSDFSTQS